MEEIKKTKTGAQLLFASSVLVCVFLFLGVLQCEIIYMCVALGTSWSSESSSRLLRHINVDHLPFS
jgi:hypothetical protein